MLVASSQIIPPPPRSRIRSAAPATRRAVLAAAAGLIGLAAFGSRPRPASAGDSLYGRVAEVKAANLVVLDYGAGSYVVRLIGVDAPREGLLAERSMEFVRKLVLGKNARLRFEGRAENGDMVGTLSTDDPVIGIKDVGLELVRSGLARRTPNYDYKYGELSAAEGEARKARRGLWAPMRR